MSTFLLVGQSFHTLRDYLDACGDNYITLQDAAKTKHPDKRLKNRVVCDFSSPQTMLATVDKIVQKQPINGVIAVYENYILATAQIADHLNLPGLSVKSAEACTDKFQMRQLFAKSAEPISPGYALVDSKSDLTNFAANHDFPLILKPANLAKSLLVTKNHDLGELMSNYHKTLDNIERVYKKYAPARQPKLIVEEFLVGSIHSVDAFVDKNGVPHVLKQVVDYQTGYDVGFDDNFHYSRVLPSKLPMETIKAIRQTATIGCQALGMRSSPAHVEIILTDKGPRIVEIGARNGGYRDRMHKLANGLDILGAARSLALGEKPDISASRNDSCAVLELFPREPGLFAGISKIDRLKELPSITYVNVKAKPGEHVGKSSDGYKMSAVVMLHNPDRQQFDKDLEFVNDQVRIQTKP